MFRKVWSLWETRMDLRRVTFGLRLTTMSKNQDLASVKEVKFYLKVMSNWQFGGRGGSTD